MILEILISTMNKTSLSFLDKMFPYCQKETLNILTINQTKKGKELMSEYENIRVINSYEKGLSKSRNLAIKNAVGDICLIADDDVEYVKNFQGIIKEAFSSLKNTSIIKFRIDTFSGENYKIYPKRSKKLDNKKEIRGVSSIEIAFRRKNILNNNISFDALFGLGSVFNSGEEYLFLRQALNKKLIIYFENTTIVKHSIEHSTSNMGSDDFIRAQAAIYYLDYKSFGYLFLLKLIFFLLRKGLINFNTVSSKYNLGVKAIKEYKILSNCVY